MFADEFFKRLDSFERDVVFRLAEVDVSARVRAVGRHGQRRGGGGEGKMQNAKCKSQGRGRRSARFTRCQNPPPRALILDFDGLVLDTETAVFEAWREFYERRGNI